MNNEPLARTFREELEAFFGGSRCFLLAKGRVACYVGLRALGLPPKSRILLPGYTCMVVPSAVQYAGLTPVYADIDPATYNLDPAGLDQPIAEGVAAVVIQHTYGIPCDFAAIQRWAGAHDVPIIEDCCHTFGTRVEGRLCGTLGVFSFMSGQWNKPFCTGLGGMLLVNDPAIADSAAEVIHREAASPGALRSLLLRAQLTAYDLFFSPSTAGIATDLYRFLNRFGLVIGSSSLEELRGVMPRGYLSTMARCQIRRGLRAIVHIAENIDHRTRMTQFYHARLPAAGFLPLAHMPVEGYPLLRYPVRVANKEEVLAAARRGRVEIGDWFEAPLHPAGTRMEDFGYRPGMCPHAERASREVINLPTHLKVDLSTAEKTLQFLARHGRCVE